MFHFVNGLSVLIGLSAIQVFAADPTSRVFKYTAANDQTYFAVILKTTELPAGVVSRDHLILVDTSASQVGEHRQQSIGVVEALLKALPDGDRVRLFAVDLRADALDEGFNDVRTPAMTTGVEALKARVPLGATNLEGVLRTAMQAAKDRPTDIVYIGDGMSTADLIEIPELRSLVSDLRQRQMPIHSFGVGAQRNMQLLGVLGHQTGGYVTFDAQRLDIDDKTDDKDAKKPAKTKPGKLAKDISRINRSAMERAAEQGQALAAAMKLPVFFPTQLQTVPEGIALLPAEALPMRMDRETIYVLHGSIANDARIVMADAATKKLEWKLATPVEQPGLTFLPMMATQLESSGGLTNPLAGITLFHLAQSDFSDYVTAIADRAMQALQLGDIEQAKKMSQSVFEADPNNESGKILRKAIALFLEQSAKQPKGAVIKPIPSDKPRPAPSAGKKD